MDDLKFNIYAFVAPTTRTEYLALLNEAIRIIDELSDQVDELLKAPEE